MQMKKKTVGIMVGFLALLLVIGCWRNLRPGIFVGDKFLVKKSEEYFKSGDDEIRMIKGDGFTNFQIVMDGEEKTAGLVWSRNDRMYGIEHDYAEITFSDGTVIAGTWFTNMMLVNDKGTPLILLNNPIVISINDEVVPISNETLSNVLCRLDLGMIERNGSGAFVVVGALVYVLGAVTILYPETMHFLGSRWRYRNAELSEDGKMMEQFGGVICMIFGFLVAMNVTGVR
ncbi:MAG: hypothetical protein IJ374_03055 [Lachnospiraceae bacterium]|nr:hypothetical protein [Lachnospiraceae bacterium]